MLQGPLPQSAGGPPGTPLHSTYTAGGPPGTPLHSTYIVGGPPGTPLPSLYTAGGPPGTPLLIYSSGSQQGFPTHIPPLTIASLPTRGVLCQRHSPECNYTLPQTILLISHMHVLNFLTSSYNYLLGIIIMLWQRGKFGRSQNKPKEKNKRKKTTTTTPK